MRLSMEQRFWAKVAKAGPNECWLWTAYRSAFGHGQFRVSKVPNRKDNAARIAYALSFGPIPDGMVIRHKCDNPPCVNPAHLEIGTHADNVADRVKRGRSAIGSGNGRAKLTEKTADCIRVGYQIGNTKAQLAREYGVSQRTVADIVNGKKWKHVS